MNISISAVYGGFGAPPSTLTARYQVGTRPGQRGVRGKCIALGRRHRRAIPDMLDIMNNSKQMSMNGDMVSTADAALPSHNRQIARAAGAAPSLRPARNLTYCETRKREIL